MDAVDTFGIEAGRHALQLGKAPREQRCADREPESRGDLGDDQHVAKRRAARSGGDRAGQIAD
jgi:hypothetical protein